MTEKKTVKSLQWNYKQILTQHALFKNKFRFNLFSNSAECQGFWWRPDNHTFDDYDLIKIRELLGYGYEIDNQNLTLSGVISAAHEHEYNPLVDLLHGLTWDGKPRMETLFHKYLGTEVSELNTAITKNLFYGLTQRILRPGCKFDYCTVFHGGQGAGKSSFARFLAIEDQYFCDSMDNLGDSDKVYRKLRGALIIEWAEMLATNKSKDIETIKAVLSATHDTYCEKYEKTTQSIPRHCVFVGTTNENEFLPPDITGNRRFVPVYCHTDRAEKHPMEYEEECRADILQCYAEAIVCGQEEGYPLTIPKKYLEELEIMQEHAAPKDTRIGMIQSWLEDNNYPEWICTRLIADRVLDVEKEDFTPYLNKDLTRILDHEIPQYERYSPKGVKDSRHVFPIYGRQRAWLLSRNCQEL